MEKVPTAEELLAQQAYPEPEYEPEDALRFIQDDLKSGKRHYSAKEAINLAISLAKLHVKACKEEIMSKISRPVFPDIPFGIVENSYPESKIL